jgi:hypothetical protein
MASEKVALRVVVSVQTGFCFRLSGMCHSFFLLAPSSAPYLLDLLNEFLVFKIECNYFRLYVKGAAFQFIVHLLVFKDTFILRFYSICVNCYIFFFVMG